jgi:hypothetical protein
MEVYSLSHSPLNVCDLYGRGALQTLKQTLRLSEFWGYRWQVWTALRVYVLLRFTAHLSQWAHSFNRLLALVRAALWERLDALGLLRSYGTAGGSFKLPGAAQPSRLPGFQPSLT